MDSSNTLFPDLEFLEAIHAAEANAAPVFDLSDAERRLNRMLSLTLSRDVSTTSSSAEQRTVTHTAVQKDSKEGNESFKKIGAGACGAIFAQEGKSTVLKLLKTTDYDLWNDYVMHKRIEHNFHKYHIDDIKVPQCYYFVPKDEAVYFDQRPGLVDAAQEVCHLPTDALVTERIPPLPKPTRTLLIDKYCSPQIKKSALADAANNDCLVRVYLGSYQGKNNGMFFSLRNFKLHLNQMVEIRLDITAMARRMATAMAIMHWAAKTDARDVEFVLGSSIKKTSLAIHSEEVDQLEPGTYTGPPSYRDEDFFHHSQTTHLWLLDFNQVRSITMDEAGVAQAVEAARINDPYIPSRCRIHGPRSRFGTHL